ncbi:PREDICTED: uncharacterized protein LOC107330673 [Acropora digitifera]|uniref:uncharacterized protein LOC107330673 n=1 Tax=Acropora digitifera TaxID=70779 RepID=UPI00077AF599|nr:PREDICTED: uncharacterized protein LOC107330673 [Acropora digitifera]
MFFPQGPIYCCGYFFGGTCAYVLDVFSGIVRFKLSHYDDETHGFNFISDEEFVILSHHHTRGASLRLFSARSGDILSVLQVYSGDDSMYLAACPGEGLIAICSRLKFDLKVVKVKLSERGNASRKAKRVKFL